MIFERVKVTGAGNGWFYDKGKRVRSSLEQRIVCGVHIFGKLGGIVKIFVEKCSFS